VWLEVKRLLCFCLSKNSQSIALVLPRQNHESVAFFCLSKTTHAKITQQVKQKKRSFTLPFKVRKGKLVKICSALLLQRILPLKLKYAILRTFYVSNYVRHVKRSYTAYFSLKSLPFLNLKGKGYKTFFTCQNCI
jgi:hypothetical protein